MSSDVRKYCCDPFKKHLNLRIASARLIAEHPSLFMQIGDLVCVNCLNQFTHTKSPFCIERDGYSANVCENSIKKPWRTFKTKPTRVHIYMNQQLE